MNNRLPLDRIVQGDCVETLEQFPQESIDLIFADPPYNLQLNQELWRPNNTQVDAVDDDWDQFASSEAYDRFTESWLLACRRVLKRTGTLWVIGSYHNIYRVGKILQDLNFWVLNDVVWIKTNPMPNFRGVRFTNAHETLLWVQKEKGAKYTFNHRTMKSLNEDKQMRSDWVLPICSGKERIQINGKKAHSTQKPEALLYRVIQSSSNSGDVVLDPFFGSGTTGAVAKKLHRHWIGIEREEKYVRVAQERIDSIKQVELDPGIFTTANPKKEPRIPFGNLLEAGLLQPGQQVYFDKDPKLAARVMADGSLEFNSEQGSIHQIGGLIHKGPRNGWDHWYYLDSTQEYRSIDELRSVIRNGLEEPLPAQQSETIQHS
ncbi:MAG: site-specific DNA-methyltransferase [Chloroflexi bacterium]|nr:site-specific DNA-methyltransferase [Chloroflexota bacterium]